MNDLFRYFQIISKHSNEYLDNKLKDFGLCSSHRVFIKRIYEHPGITRDKLKNIAHVHPSNTTRAIDYLEENGYIKKQNKAEDKRICELYPCEKLKEVYDILIQSEKEWIDIITKDMSEEEINLYTILLKTSSDLSIDCIHNNK